MKIANEIKKVRINFNEPHITYRDNEGSPVVGVTTATNLLNKPALPGWGFNQGKKPKYKNITEAIKDTEYDVKDLNKEKLMLWAFDAGQKRKYSSLHESVDKAANIGTIAHEILKGKELGYEIDSSNITPENWEAALQAIKSHDKWFEGMKIKTIFVETPLVSEVYKYGGTLDKYAYVTKERTLIDYKSGKDIYEEHYLQTTGYSKLLIENGHPLKRVIIVNMPKQKGDNFKIESYDVNYLFEAGYFDKFLKCVGIYYDNIKIKAFKEGE